MKLVSVAEKKCLLCMKVQEDSTHKVLALSFFFSKISLVRSCKALDFEQIAKCR